VLEYEPHCALFTPDNEPLIFYKRIAEFGLKCLKDKGRIFFEINEAYSAETADILKQYDYTNIIPRKDINGKWRMIAATRKFQYSL
jgi:release factor glutamine methyltransferase